MAASADEHFVATTVDDNEPTCWGCGLHLILPSYTPTFKCGWCGAITNQNIWKRESKYSYWRRLRDCFFVCVLLIFMLFVICGGVWAVYPVVFSISYFYGIFHLTITTILSISTLSTFSLAAFSCAGTPPSIMWGTYPLVGKGDLENYTFCHYCSKPKCPRSHHCQICGICVLDLDHHCPFIGNCVGAANHRHFITFLILTVVSTIYVAIMSINAGLQIWPPVSLRSRIHLHGLSTDTALAIMKEIILALLNSAEHLSTRGLLLVYLFVASISVNVGLSVLLWQQLRFIYKGETYLSHLASQGSEQDGVKDCQNLFHFFGCPYSVSRYLPIMRSSPKTHKK
ncbi:protein S-acyltransferase 11 [Mangifera indica]|uniref:protein S-acyltransferase 11 n=1 Tax=Mangifera indica TaxID=29780 RepID=UPI001CFA9B43|nr:protein S-acyltransferase 11 [Mangifera indica]XP_044494838.1 protein S-acyltransferase 11 [Mangifera indica]XP_044494839.1 protein S-acyltransferase 11 [Mangifera indica]